MASPGSEFDVRPSGVLVHDPVAAGAFKAFEGVNNDYDIRRDFLYESKPNSSVFARQYHDFVERLRENIDNVHYLTDILGAEKATALTKHNPNQVYTRDALITIPWVPNGYLVGNMFMPIRRSESRALVDSCEALGMEEIVKLQGKYMLEGGDVIPFIREGRRAFLIGYGRRTQLDTIYALRDLLIPDYLDEIIGIELAQWRINLDGGLVPVADDVVLMQRDSLLGAIFLDERGEYVEDPVAMFMDLDYNIIEVDIYESRFQQACNCFCVGNRKVICYDLCRPVVDQLTSLDIVVITVPGSELVKGTGGPRCMTRPIYRKALE